MDLRDYVRVLRKSWALILAITVVGIALGVGLTLVTTKVYSASTKVFVSYNPAIAANAANPAGLNQFVAQQVQSYIELASSSDVASAAVKQLNDDVDSGKSGVGYSKGDTIPTADTLANHVKATAPSSLVIVQISVTDNNPAHAATLANYVTTAFNKAVGDTAQVTVPCTTDLTTGCGPKVFYPTVTLKTIQAATIPSDPVKPNKILNIGLGLALGLFIGIGVAITREVLDNTVKNARDFEELGIPLLAQVAFDKRAGRNVIAFRGDAHSARSEAYRQLRTNLQFVDVDNPPRIIAVTSAVPGEGKSTTAINLAAALAEAGARVCLVEADLRRPSIAKALGLVSDVGFTTVVIGRAPVETVLQNAGRNLAVLTCGPIPPNPSELLISQHARQVIYDIAEKVDFTIIDTPPLLPVTDGAEIATIADATILVHRAAKTTRDQAARSLEALAKVGRKPVGVVLNMVTRGNGGRYDYEYGYYYAAYRSKTTPTAAPAEGADPTDNAFALPTTSRPAAASAETPAAMAAALAVPATEAPAGADTPDTSGTPETPAAPAAKAAEPLSHGPRGRRARHRNRRAAEGAEAAAVAPEVADITDTAAFAPVGSNGRVRDDETSADPAADTTAETPAVSTEDAATTGPVPAVDDAVQLPAADGEYADDYADEYDAEFDDEDADYTGADEDDEFTLVPPAASAEDDETDGVDGQEELPLDGRGRHDDAVSDRR